MRENLISKLSLGEKPCVVGTIITAEYLGAWNANPAPLPCDLVELRIDGFSAMPDWAETGAKMEARGIPVLATVRLAREGGKWTEADAERWPLLKLAIESVSGVDVELDSDLAGRVAAAARAAQKSCVVSHHDFDRTPAPTRLAEIVSGAAKLGSVAKIAAKANTEADVENLRALLDHNWGVPLCVIGMGPLGRETRLSFPKEGSCFTYGYLDQPGAPGQYSARELKEYFRRS